MKKIILLITFILTAFFSLLPAEEAKDYAHVSIFEIRGETVVYESNRTKTFFKDINVTFKYLKSTDTHLTISNITQQSQSFTDIPEEETFEDTNITYWLKVDLGNNFPSGRFVYSYADADFSEHTIQSYQHLEKFTLSGVKRMKFSYNQSSDAQIYYFKLVPKHFRFPFRFLNVSTSETFYKHQKEEVDIAFILGLILGLIIMAGIYNASMYYYNKDISFLYYALMQLFMVLILYDMSGAYVWDADSFFCRNLTYENVISLMAALFATYFTMTFLDTKKYLPRLHTILQFGIMLIIVDIIISLFYKSLIIEYYILPFLMLPFIYAGYKRIQQEYKPAYFYLAGWTVLTVSVFINIFVINIDFLPIDPLYIGSSVEAILLSLALSYKIRMVSQEKEAQKELLVHQSKLASMGEMIGNIAHQWRQPLSHLSYTFMNIKEAQKHGELDENYITKKVDEATVQLEFMSQTIDDFKDFYLPTKEKEYFTLSTATEETLEIMKHTFKVSDIEVLFNIEEDFEIYNYKNEYKQVLLNLLSNAKDALIERVILSPKIAISIANHTVIVSDNAGGIKSEILDRIFEPYFTTKEGNSGIGLYMSKMIVERNMKGKLKLTSTKEGAKFLLKF